MLITNKEGTNTLEKLKYLEFNIVDHCNLKYIACTHFSNISKPNFVDIKELGFQLQRLSKIFTIKDIRVLGGEPLLHPDIINILVCTRNFFSYSNIELVSNGLLLNKMPENFFRYVEKYDINIYISNYPHVLHNLNKIKNFLSSFNIKYTISPEIVDFTAILNPHGVSDKEKSFKSCRQKKCTILRNNNIYVCPICAYIDKYNKYFNKNIPYLKGINIYTHSAKQILEYLSNSEETCGYCIDNNYIKWSCSNNPKETDWYANI